MPTTTTPSHAVIDGNGTFGFISINEGRSRPLGSYLVGTHEIIFSPPKVILLSSFQESNKGGELGGTDRSRELVGVSYYTFGR